MKFTIGDRISINLENGMFLAGIISSLEGGKYGIVLGDYHQRTAPTADYFSDCLVFSTRFEMGETSFSVLDIVIIDPEYMDQSTDIELVAHVEIPGFLPAAGFQEIQNIGELQKFFEAGKRLRDEKKDNTVVGFEIKCFLSITDFLNKIPPANNFITVKLYREIDSVIHYWQIYGSSIDPLFLVIHWGRLGENGELIEIKDQSLTDLSEAYDVQISGKRNEGYHEAEELHRMILQFQAAEGWGGPADLDFRNEIWEYLDRFLFWTGNGSISGGDIGSGTVNLFFEALIPEIAINTIVYALQEKKIERPYLIALESSQDKGDDDSFSIRVLYPTNYQGSFSY